MSSPTTLAPAVDDRSDTRTTLTSAPLADKPSARALLNVARPQTVGGYVPRIPSVGGTEKPSPAMEMGEKVTLEGTFMVIPSGGCHRHIRRERMLCVISGGMLNHPGLTGFPTLSTLHPVGLTGMVGADATRQSAGHRSVAITYSIVAQRTSEPQFALSRRFGWGSCRFGGCGVADGGCVTGRARRAPMTPLPRADQTIQASLVNPGFCHTPQPRHPSWDSRPLRTRETGRSARWQWVNVEGRAELAGPDDPQNWLGEPDDIVRYPWLEMSRSTFSAPPDTSSGADWSVNQRFLG